MGSDKLCCALLSDNRRSHCALGWTSGQTYLIKLEDLGDDCFPVVFFFFSEYLIFIQLFKATSLS